MCTKVLKVLIQIEVGMKEAVTLSRMTHVVNKYRICTELAQGIFFVVFEISAAELLHTCCRDSGDLILPCCSGAAESTIDVTYQILSL